jgi:hypothetical protein
MLERQHIPAGAGLAVVPELARLDAAVVLQAPDLFAGLGLARVSGVDSARRTVDDRRTCCGDWDS